MGIRAGYKQTEVGVIPEDWKVKSVGQIADVKTGPFGSALHERDYVLEGTPIITVEHLGEFGVEHINLPQVSDTDKSRLQAYLLEEGDIVFSRVGSVDRNALIKSSEDGWLFSGRLLRVRPIQNIVSANYLSFHFHSEPFKQRVKEVAVGQTMASINTKILSDVKALIPPTLAEQKAIAAALSDVDALIAALEGLIAKKRQIKQGSMQELLSGESGKWEVKSLGEIAHIQTGGKNNQDKVENGMYPFFVRSATVEQINTYSYDCEAILVPGEGGIGNIFHYINGKFDVHQRVYVITRFDDEVSGKFIYLYMSQHFGKHAMKNTVKATVDSLRLPTFLNFEIALPSTKEQQSAIAAILSEMDAEIAALEGKLSKTRQIKEGMMQALLTGRVRLTP